MEPGYEIGYSQGEKVISNQLAKSAASIGADYKESQASQPKDDFYYKIGICLRDRDDSTELVKVFGKIFSGRK